MKKSASRTVVYLCYLGSASFLGSRRAAQAFVVPRRLKSEVPLTRTFATSSSSPPSTTTTAEEDEAFWPLPEPVWVCPQHNNICQQTGVTLSRYMLEMARVNPELGDVENIMTSLQTACKTISSLVRRSSLDGLLGLQDETGNSVNVQGEQQKKLDVITNDVLKKALHWSGKLATLASEEEDTPVILDNFGNQVYSGDIVVEESGK
jgi:hypothetical protein